MATLTQNLTRDKRLQRQSAHPAVTEIVSHIGGTPLIELPSITFGLPKQISVLAKAEFMNPGGSVKARPAWRIMQEGIRTGALTREKILIDATSGNTGIAYALLGAALDLRILLVMPANASESRKQIVKAFGAELELSDPKELTDGAQRRVRDLVSRDPERYFYADQYNNPANWRAHYDTTGKEILTQTEGRVTHFVASLGTTGTFTGVARRLRLHKPDVRCIAVQPDSPLHGIEGVKHLETALLVPGIFDARLVDEELCVSTEEAQAMTRRLAREEGLLVGISSGANVVASLRVAERLSEGTVITVLCDDGTHYLGESFWEEPSP
ncbi:MAG: cysteine synthase family protein [Bacteroidetes bacterium]|nr:MAG: cysteine synthase family protein [Bacteroidota bacterium]